MIYLNRIRPHKLDAIEVLLRRATLSINNRQLFEDQLLKLSLGFEGECYADNYWLDLRLPIHYALLHGFETTHHQLFHHQMDTIFICSHFILITELKYIAGEIFYNETLNQLWRNYNGQQIALGDPFAQVARHEMWMSNFLWEMGMDVPVISAVIVTAKSALLREMPQRYNVFKIDGLGLKLKDWLVKYPAIITWEEINRIAKELLSRHQPRKWDWKKVLNEVVIKKGVLCSCGKTMQYFNGNFVCVCGLKSRKGMYEALNDYRIIQSEWISNGELRDFLGIKSANTALKILKRISEEEKGLNKARKYKLSEEKLKLKMGGLG